MKNKILIILIAAVFFGFVGPQWSIAQTGSVPELKDISEAAKIVRTEHDILEKQIQEIRNNGGTVEDILIDKFELYKSVLVILEGNSPGMTTFNALASNSNRKNLLLDDEAYQLFLDGQWDENMTGLINLLAK